MAQLTDNQFVRKYGLAAYFASGFNLYDTVRALAQISIETGQIDCKTPNSALFCKTKNVPAIMYIEPEVNRKNFERVGAKYKQFYKTEPYLVPSNASIGQPTEWRQYANWFNAFRDFFQLMKTFYPNVWAQQTPQEWSKALQNSPYCYQCPQYGQLIVDKYYKLKGEVEKELALFGLFVFCGIAIIFLIIKKAKIAIQFTIIFALFTWLLTRYRANI